MFYPEDFKNRVKKAFPTWEKMHQKLDEGDPAVGLYLADAPSENMKFNSYGAIPVEEILKATSLEELQNKARAIVERGKLYSEWRKLSEEQEKNN